MAALLATGHDRLAGAGHEAKRAIFRSAHGRVILFIPTPKYLRHVVGVIADRELRRVFAGEVLGISLLQLLLPRGARR
jgi:hypothetical protein